MNKIIAISALAAIMASACTKENLVETTQTSNVPMKTVTFTADELTKTTVTLEGKVAWEEGDSISVYYIASDNSAKETVSFAKLNGGAASFKISIPETESPVRYYASYPAHYGTLTPGADESSASFGISVIYGDGSFARSNIMAACTSAGSGNFAFKNACGILRIKLPDGGKITKGSKEYTIKDITIGGQKALLRATSSTPVPVTITNNAVSGFGDVAGTPADSTVAEEIPQSVLQSGYAYLPCLPASASKGIYVYYTTVEGEPVPAVLSDSTKAVTVERGHIKPVPDVTSKIVYDYYVSASGSGDGKSEASPMSFAKMTEMFTTAANYAYGTYHVDDVTFHLMGENFDASAATPFQTSSATSATITVEGGWQGGATVIDGGAKVRLVNNPSSNWTFKNITFKNGAVSTVGGGAIYSKAGNLKFFDCMFDSNDSGNTKGGGIHILNGNLEAVRCNFIDNKCTANSGGGIYLHSTFAGHAYFTNCIFAGNDTGQNYGSAIHCAQQTIAVYATSFVGLNNCLFVNNTGTRTGDGTGSVNICLAHCIVNTSIISQASDKNIYGIRNGAAIDAGAASGSLIVNSIINNENTASSTYSMSVVSAKKYALRSVGHNQYSAVNETAFTASEDDNQIGLPCEGSKATLNSYTWDKASLAWAWDASSKTGDMLAIDDLKDLIENDAIESAATVVQPKAKAFLAWLESISFNDGADNAFTVDLYGTHRDPEAIWPGCYQK